MATDSERTSRLEGIAEETSGRLGGIESRLNSIESRMDTRFTGVDNRFSALENCITAFESRIDSRFNWLFGLIVTVWITMILAVLLGP